MEYVMDHLDGADSPTNDKIACIEIPRGLNTFGNQCYINTTFQCLTSLRSMIPFTAVRTIPESDETLFLRRMQQEMSAFITNDMNRVLVGTLRMVAEKLGGSPKLWNQQHDASELLDAFFADLETFVPKLFKSFAVTSSGVCGGIQAQLSSSWCMTVNVSPDCNVLNLTEGLRNAVHIQDGDACSCGKPQMHIYGEMPRCLALKIYKFNAENLVRKDVQMIVQPNQTIAGVKYELKSAVQYVGKDYLGGAPKLWQKLKVYWHEIRHGKQMLPVRKFFPVEKDDYEDDEDDMPSNTTNSPVETKRCELPFPRSPFSSAGFCYASQVFLTPSPPAKPAHKTAKFISLQRDGKPPTDGTSGHYTAFVRRHDQWYYVNDEIVTKTDTVITDDLFVLFYEKVASE